MMANSFSKHIPLNLMTNIGVFILSIIVNLFMTPFYIKYLGVDGLGVIRLALLLPVYINLATLIISGSVSRFLTIDLHKQNHKGANETFNTSFFGISAILIIAVPFIVYFALHIASFLNIPDQFTEQSKYLFLGIFLGSEITIFSTLFLIPAYANNRLDVQNYIKIITLLMQTSIIIIAFVFISSNITYIGYAYTSAALVGLVLSFLVRKQFAPFLKINKVFIQIKKLKEILSMGSWMLINQLGSILFLSVDLLVINYYFGSKATGEYSIVLQWSILLRSMAGMIASVLGPIILINYAKKNYDKIVEYSNLSIKYMGILVAIPVGLIMGFGAPLFYLWLGPDFVHLVPLLWLSIGHLAINLAMLPLFFINTTFNKVKVPGLVAISTGVVNLFIAIFLAVQLEMGIYGVALAGVIVLTLKNLFFQPLYSSHILGQGKFVFLKSGLMGVCVFIVTFFSAYLLQSIIQIHTWYKLFFYAIIILSIILFVTWKFLLNYDEKQVLVSKLFKKGI